jgi:hypothetical protein
MNITPGGTSVKSVFKAGAQRGEAAQALGVIEIGCTVIAPGMR